jgi:hypothetical protein
MPEFHRLLDRDRLGEVSRKVHVNSIEHGQVVRQQLQRNDGKDALQAVDGWRHRDGQVVPVQAGVAFVADNDGPALAGLNLLKGTANLLHDHVSE